MKKKLGFAWLGQNMRSVLPLILLSVSLNRCYGQVSSEAELNAELLAGSTNIELSENVQIELGSHLSTPSSVVSIKGNHGVIDGNGHRILIISGHFGGLQDITLQKATYDHSWSGISAGALYVPNDLQGGLSNVRLLNNAGSAILVRGNFLNGIKESTISGNISYKNFGGAIGIIGNFSGGISDSCFEGNQLTRNPATASGITTTHFGGALGVGGTLSGGISNSTFLQNTNYSDIPSRSSYYGGALSAARIEGGIRDSRFEENVAGNFGGAIALAASSSSTGILTGGIHNSSFINNHAGSGGAIYSAGGSVGGTEGLAGGIFNSLFKKNSADLDGGAIIAHYINDEIKNTQFQENTATGYGGAIAVLRRLSGVVKNSEFSGNKVASGTEKTSGLGGALFVRGNLVIEGSSFSGNSASTALFSDMTGGRGGAIFHDSSSAVNQIELKTTDVNFPLLFLGNIQNQGNLGEERNAIYFGITQTSGGTIGMTTNVIVDAAEKTSVLMFDPLASQENGLMTLNIEKKGAGSWLLGGHNQMKSAGHWAIQEGELHLIGKAPDGTAVPVKIDLSHRDSSFHLQNGAKVMMTLESSPHEIIATDIVLESGSSSGVRGDYGENFVTWSVLPTSPIPVLELKGLNLTNEQEVDQLPGELKIGVENYDYRLYWGGADQNTLYLELVGKGTFDPERAGVAAITAPGVIVYRNPLNHQVFERATEQFQSERTNHQLADRFWVTPLYDLVKQSSGSGRLGYDITTYGVALGYDRWISEKAFLGVAANLSYPEFNSHDADVTSNDYTGLIYGGVRLPHNLQLTAFAGYGKGDYTQSRRVHGYRYKADYEVDHYRFGVELSRKFKLKENTFLRPFVSYEYYRLNAGGYDEGNGAYALKVTDFSQNISRVRIGGEYTWLKKTDADVSVQLYYGALLGDRHGTGAIRFNQDELKTPYCISGDSLDHSVIGLAVKGSVQLNKKTTLSGTYILEKGRHLTGHQVYLNLRYVW